MRRVISVTRRYIEFLFSHEEKVMFATRKKLRRQIAELEAALVELKPAEVLVEGSFFPVDELPTILGNFMRSSAQYARDAKSEYLRSEEIRADRDRLAAMVSGEGDWQLPSTDDDKTGQDVE
jgi:hypothetical protein